MVRTWVVARRYSSFVVRCWVLDSGERRITIEHIQSRERFQSDSIAAALDWAHARSGSSSGCSSADAMGGDGEASASSPDAPGQQNPPPGATAPP